MALAGWCVCLTDYRYPSIGLCKSTSQDVLLHTSQKDHKLPYRCMKIFCTGTMYLYLYNVIYQNLLSISTTCIVHAFSTKYILGRTFT